MSSSSQRHRRVCNERGHAHELTFSCYRSYPFLSRERVCEWLADAIRQTRRELGMRLWAYVFMPNHVHLLVHFGSRDSRALQNPLAEEDGSVFVERNLPPTGFCKVLYEIARVLRALKGPVSRRGLAYLRQHSPEWLPRLSAQRGSRTEYHFWQRGGGYDRNVTEPATLERMIDYIDLNPVRKQLVERATDWKWSSASWYRDGAGPIELDRIPPEWTVAETRPGGW